MQSSITSLNMSLTIRQNKMHHVYLAKTQAYVNSFLLC